MPPLLLACLAYLGVALPGSTLGLVWPSMRLSLGEPVSALGILLVSGITASVISSAATGRLRVRTGPLVAVGTMLTALALAAEFFRGLAVGDGRRHRAVRPRLRVARHRAQRARRPAFRCPGHQLDARQLRARRHRRAPARHDPACRRARLAPGLRDHGARPGRPGLRAHPDPPPLASAWTAARRPASRGPASRRPASRRPGSRRPGSRRPGSRRPGSCGPASPRSASPGPASPGAADPGPASQQDAGASFR